MFRHVPLRVAMFLYLFVRFGTFRYVLIKIRTFSTKNYQHVPNPIESYTNLQKRTVTYSDIHLRMKMNGNILVCTKWMYQNANIFVPIRTEPYRNVPNRTATYRNVLTRTETYEHVPKRTKTQSNVHQHRWTYRNTRLHT